jgi:putative ABC transport system permease protein
MDTVRFALRNISGNPFRFTVIVLCASLTSGMLLASTLILLGAHASLNKTIERLGADIVVVPESAASQLESSLILGHATDAWMPTAAVRQVAAVPGVQAASPQIHLATLKNASCCTVSNMFLMVYDPASDFVITPWLENNLGAQLRRGEAIGGRDVFLPAGDTSLKVYGYPVTLRANMEATGTGLDNSLFFTMETALEIASASRTKAQAPLVIPKGSISAVLVRVRPEYAAVSVARDISDRIAGVKAVASAEMFRSQRTALKGLRNSIALMLAISLVFSELLVAAVFSMAANERRRELGIVRALGGSRTFVLRALLFEAGFLAVQGGAAGSLITIFAVILFHRLIIVTLGIPFLLPSMPMLTVLIAGGLVGALGTVLLASLIPAYRISHADPSMAMRE